jgi:ABC-2 type transport system ATP-binding protein
LRSAKENGVSQATSVIAFEKSSKHYGRLTAVDTFSLTIAKGETIALLGPNGAGKTTLVRMLMGFSRPSTGRVRINGLDAGTAASRRGVGYLAERHLIPPALSGKAYLCRHAALLGLGGKEAASEVERVIDVVGMTGRERERAGAYSKGMTQRFGLAAALLGSPSLLILDEPVSGLDPIGIREFRTILDNLRANGTTFLLNSHLLSEVEKTCSRVVILHHGRKLLEGALKDVVTGDESLEDLFVRLVGGNHA